MGQGARDVRNVGTVADEANRALGIMLDGIRRISDVVVETAGVSRDQSATMDTLTASIAGIQNVAIEASARAAAAALVATQQTAALGELSTTSLQLAALADRLRHSISRFDVTGEAPGAPPHASVGALASPRPNPAEPSGAGDPAAR